MLVAERAASPHTLDAYRRDLLQAAGFMQKAKGDLATADASLVARFLKNISALAPKSRARKLSSLRQYYRFLVSEGVRQDDPTSEQESIKLPRKIPDVLSVDETMRLIEALQGDTPERLRLRAMLELSYGSGLRASELVALPLASFHGAKAAIIVRGKGDKERLVPLSQASRDAVAAYLAIRKGFVRKGDASPYLFPSGKKHISRIRFYQMLKDLAVRAGVEHRKVHPHALRHAFATHLLSGGADLRALQTMLGHADIGTTQIYTHVVRDHLKNTVETHHPLAKKSGLGRKS